MSNAWDRLKNIDINEFNQTNADVFSARYSPEQGLNVTLSQIFEEHYSYDVSTGAGPFLAVVLDVLSGPQVKNEAITKGRINTTCLNVDTYPYPFLKNRKAGNRDRPVIIKAKVPGQIGDADMDWPADENDLVRIDAHGEYWQFREDKTLNKIDIGSQVWVTFDNARQIVNISGRPDGKIIGVHSTAIHSDIKTRISARLAFNPECQGDNSLAGPAPGFYVGHTLDDPNPNIGPPIKKIKGHIKTGVYGNGTPQTKAHFAMALGLSNVSPKYGISGPTPNSDNAFIWIGTLKNNGYMDLLDRPLSLGRETIIYAPMTLDLTSPIEIKYYFHDKAGFGHAWIDGPSTTIDQAVANVEIPGNDFREKIGPAIKDLDKDGRNYVLIIPEMSYSRGYGTQNGELKRIEELSSGQAVSPGARTGETIRTKINSITRGAVKNYLNGLPIETTKNLLHVTPLREREFATFDGSFTGGKFGEFHQEVLDVLDEHLGTIYDKVEFLSILADGLGGPALASILNNASFSSTRSEGQTSFKNAFFAKSVRIDYVTDSALDSRDSYGSYFVTERQDGTLKQSSPSHVIWRNFLIEHSEQAYTEFNYVTKPGLPGPKENYFFEQFGKINEYLKYTPYGGPNPSQKQKFSFYTIGKEVAPESFISLHVASKATDYAFSMVNHFLESSPGPPKKSNTGLSLKPSFDAVPDHAYALTTKPSASELEKIIKRRAALEERISYFETLIELITNDEGEDSPCSRPEYKIFCEEDETILTDGSSQFFKRYIKYLDDKKAYMETGILAEGEARIQQIINNKNELIKERNRVSNLVLQLSGIQEAYIELAYGGNGSAVAAKDTSVGIWKALRTVFNKTNFKENNYIVPGSPAQGYVAQLAQANSALDAYNKIFKKINYQIEPPPEGSGRLFPESVNKLKPCPPKLGEPLNIGDFRRPRFPGTGKSNKPGNNCSDIELSVPNTFEELAKMIPYYPKKSDFITSGKRSSKTKTRIGEIKGYKTSTFRYPARTANNNITQKESPHLWACITNTIQRAWKEACEESKYYPFEITNGIRGSQKPNVGGTTAYQNGMSLHSFGLAFDLDPFITGFGKSIIAKPSSDPLVELSSFIPKKNVYNPPLHSVYTGAWTPGFIDVHGTTLYDLGVYKEKQDILIKNAYEAENRPRMTENWRAAPSHYPGGGESGGARQKYTKIMKSAKGTPIVSPGTNPTLWIILFCEKSGMKWGNGRFLKHRWKGGKIWSKEEKDIISDIFQIQNIVDRIQAISWNSTQDDHMHIHYWGNRALIYWNEITKASKNKG